jgi:uncharacterized protein (TIGR03083 family)
MEESLGLWVSALRHSHDRLQALVQPLGEEALRAPSYDSEWSIAQVLSHLGSQSEIFEMFLVAGLAGEDPPGAEAFSPIWEAWNARDPVAQASDALSFDEAVISHFESLSAEEAERFHLSLFGMELNATGLSRLRLSEHAVHTWDVAVALDPSAELAPDAVALLVDTLGPLVARSGKSDGGGRRLEVSTTAPERRFRLEMGETVLLTPSDSVASADLSLPAAAFVRLVYGRLDPVHTPALEAPGVDLDELRQVFQGI